MSSSGQESRDIPLVLAVTGASGAAYAVALLGRLAAQQVPVDLVVSRNGWDLLQRETGLADEQKLFAHLDGCGIQSGGITVYDNGDLGAPCASGSRPSRGMVICPCSTKTLSAVAAGACRCLIERAAEVALKERRKLILVPRESPYSLIQIENMRTLTLAGATVLPASPAFYNRPQTVEDLVDFIAARILDHLGLEQNLVRPWDGGD
ncbi:MAG: flavin prenyltransferase UbiX [Gemmatimonadota bacterium]|nr:flavin prenyltransferase UbiX [Gemmatimonadota bacterium]